MNKKLAFKADRTLPATKDIKPPQVKATVTFTFKVDDATEEAIYDYYKKNAQKYLDGKLDSRLADFVDPIVDAQKKVDDLRTKMTSKLERMPSLVDPSAVDEFKKAKEAADTSVKSLEDFLSTANALIKQAIASIEKTEISGWFKEFEKKAVAASGKAKKAKNRKEVILVAKVVMTGVFVLGTAAVGIIASIASLNPGPLALAGGIIGGVVSGGSALYDTYKLKKKDWPSESRAIKKVEEDLTALGDLTKEIRNKHIANLKKHLVELSGYRATRAKGLLNYESQLEKMKKEVERLSKLAGETGDREIMSKCSEFLSYRNKILAERNALVSADKGAQAVIDRALKLVSSYENLSEGSLSKDVKDVAEDVGGAFVKLSGFCADLGSWYQDLKK